MVKVGEHITLDIIGTKKEYSPSFFEKLLYKIAKMSFLLKKCPGARGLYGRSMPLQTRPIDPRTLLGSDTKYSDRYQSVVEHMIRPSEACLETARMETFTSILPHFVWWWPGHHKGAGSPIFGRIGGGTPCSKHIPSAASNS